MQVVQIHWQWNQFDIDSQYSATFIWVRLRNCGCLVTWFCYQLIAKPGNKTATVLWPDSYWDWESLNKKHSNSVIHLGQMFFFFFFFFFFTKSCLSSLSWKITCLERPLNFSDCFIQVSVYHVWWWPGKSCDQEAWKHAVDLCTWILINIKMSFYQ